MSEFAPNFDFSAEEIEKCQAAMAKPGPREALMLIASPGVVSELSKDGRDVLLDEIDGYPVRNLGRKMPIAGAWPLFRAGMIDAACKVTDAGNELVACDRKRHALLKTFLEQNSKVASELVNLFECLLEPDGKLPFEVAFRVCAVAEKLGIVLKEDSDD